MRIIQDPVCSSTPLTWGAVPVGKGFLGNDGRLYLRLAERECVVFDGDENEKHFVTKLQPEHKIGAASMIEIVEIRYRRCA